ncbi:MAG: family DNA-binding protein [Gammaproteobacteria bacterium]|nr:family DNA-binding protein [Gammaproteobacteria bacterium]
MNNADLADHLAGSHGLTKSAAKQIVDDLLKAIAHAAAKGDEVSLNGFGKFKVQARPVRTGRNPATGATIEIAASNKLSFTPAKALKDAVNPAKPATAKT